jgi:hypothetical protein
VLDRDVWKAIGCDELLGFECSTKQVSKVSDCQRVNVIPTAQYLANPSMDTDHNLLTSGLLVHGSLTRASCKVQPGIKLGSRNGQSRPSKRPTPHTTI